MSDLNTIILEEIEMKAKPQRRTHAERTDAKVQVIIDQVRAQTAEASIRKQVETLAGGQFNFEIDVPIQMFTGDDIEHLDHYIDWLEHQGEYAARSMARIAHVYAYYYLLLSVWRPLQVQLWFRTPSEALGRFKRGGYRLTSRSRFRNPIEAIHDGDLTLTMRYCQATVRDVIRRGAVSTYLPPQRKKRTTKGPA